MTSFVATLPLSRARYFEDADGILSTSKASDEILTLVLDFANELYGAEGIVSATYETSGVTLSTTSESGTLVEMILTGVGYVIVTVTTDLGNKLQRMVRFYERDGCGVSDYE